MTNCKTPCNYKEYKLAYNPPRPISDDFGKKTVFGLLAVSENTEFQEEVLLYPRSKSENIIQSINSAIWEHPGNCLNQQNYLSIFDFFIVKLIIFVEKVNFRKISLYDLYIFVF